MDFRCAGGCDFFQQFKKVPAFFGVESAEDLVLKFLGDGLGLIEQAASFGKETNPLGPSVALVPRAGKHPAELHAAQRGRDGRRVAGHALGDFRLSQSFGRALVQPAEDGVLVRSDSKRGDALPEGLVERVPSAAQQWGEASHGPPILGLGCRGTRGPTPA